MNDAQLQSKSGHASHPVALVGAGPGASGLLTLRGRKLLELAEVVLADALVNPRMRSFAPNADWSDVGKRGGRASTPQDDITELMIEHARRKARRPAKRRRPVRIEPSVAAKILSHRLES